RFYARGGVRRENFVGPPAEDDVAGKAREALERPVGKNVAAVLDTLGGHTYRHIVEYRFQELLGRCKLSRKLALLAVILVRRHRSRDNGRCRTRSGSAHPSSPRRG